MLVERGIEALNVEVVGDAYAIASNYLRKSGAIPDTFATNERLLGIIVAAGQHQRTDRTVNDALPEAAAQRKLVDAGMH